MAISANKKALVRLASSALDAAEKAANREVLSLRVAMVELERPDSALVAAVLAASASGADKFGLHPDPPTSAVVDPRLTSTDARIIEWTRRGVVRTERRTNEAEPPAAEDAQFAVDDHSRRKPHTAGGADLHTTKIGTPSRADLASSLGRTRTSDLAVTQTPRFPWGTDYLFTMTTYRF
jgi:hypothetical protein